MIINKITTIILPETSETFEKIIKLDQGFLEIITHGTNAPFFDKKEAAELIKILEYYVATGKLLEAE